MSRDGDSVPLRMVRRDDGYLLDFFELKALTVAILERVGVPAADAAIVAGGLITADARGMNSHGILRLPVYIKRLQQGGFSPVSRFDMVQETPGTALVDGGNGLGAVLTTKAMALAIEKAREVGVAAVGVRNSNHNGEGAPYVLQAVQADMIGIATTNGSPISPVWGGKAPFFSGPLPISFGIPTAEELPIILDMALGMSSRGKVLYYAEKGLELPPGWLVDADGAPTTDPNWVKKGGWILPIGGHKGWGLALMCEILSGILTGGAFGRDLTNLYDDLQDGQHNGHFVIALNIDKFIGAAAFKSRMDDYIRQMRASEPAPGFTEILMPGEIEFRKEKKQKTEGMQLSLSVVEELLASARGLGLDVGSPHAG
jgi:LDH2 family malate/lactate/ureidoglycolate dehydrogenase